jgi:hypothetical protein
VAESEEDKRERIMRRLAEMLQGPPPTSGGPSGPVTAGNIEEAIGALGLGLSEENAGQVADAVRQGPDPEEAMALFQAMLRSFQEATGKGRAGPPGQAGETDEAGGDGTE